MDEATSSLDHETEKDFINKLNIRTTQYTSVKRKSDLDSLVAITKNNRIDEFEYWEMIVYERVSDEIKIVSTYDYNSIEDENYDKYGITKREYYNDDKCVTKEFLIKNSDIIIVAVPHKNYKKLKINRNKILIDTWNITKK